MKRIKQTTLSPQPEAIRRLGDLRAVRGAGDPNAVVIPDPDDPPKGPK